MQINNFSQVNNSFGAIVWPKTPKKRALAKRIIDNLNPDYRDGREILCELDKVREKLKNTIYHHLELPINIYEAVKLFGERWWVNTFNIVDEKGKIVTTIKKTSLDSVCDSVLELEKEHIEKIQKTTKYKKEKAKSAKAALLADFAGGG